MLFLCKSLHFGILYNCIIYLLWYWHTIRTAIIAGLIYSLAAEMAGSVYLKLSVMLTIIIIIIITDLYSAFRSEDTETLDTAQED